MALITADVAVQASPATTAIYGDGPSGDFRIGRGEIPGNELLTVNTFLEWFCENPGGGGEFGLPPPNNARICVRSQVTGDVIMAALATNFPQLDATAQVTGSVIGNGNITGAEALLEAQALLTGGMQVDTTIVGEITAAAFLDGDLTIRLFPSLSATPILDATGVRPCFPLLIWQDDVSHIGDLFEPDGVTPRLQLYQAFRMSSTYTFPLGGELAIRGATPDAIGMRVEVDLGNGIEEEILFRRPLENEIVALLDNATAERWNGLEWLSHTSIPERALGGVRVFEITDSEGIYDYYARLLGLKYAKLQDDTKRILDLVDPNLCPVDFLPLLAENFGADLVADASEETQREILRSWVPLMQIKGLDQAVRIALRQLGFSGYAAQVWTRPGALATEFIERPFNYNNEFPDETDPFAFAPAPQVVIHLNDTDGTPLVVIDDTTKQVVAAFLKRNVLPAHVVIRSFATDIPVGEDTIEAADTVAVITNVHTAIIAVRANPATISVVGSVLPNRAAIAAKAGPATVSISVTVIPASP
jgi:phage tail P2-like protein